MTLLLLGGPRSYTRLIDSDVLSSDEDRVRNKSTKAEVPGNRKKTQREKWLAELTPPPEISEERKKEIEAILACIILRLASYAGATTVLISVECTCLCLATYPPRMSATRLHHMPQPSRHMLRPYPSPLQARMTRS